MQFKITCTADVPTTLTVVLSEASNNISPLGVYALDAAINESVPLEGVQQLLPDSKSLGGSEYDESMSEITLEEVNILCCTFPSHMLWGFSCNPHCLDWNIVRGLVCP